MVHLHICSAPRSHAHVLASGAEGTWYEGVTLDQPYSYQVTIWPRIPKVLPNLQIAH
jgi:hypothetical protein